MTKKLSMQEIILILQKFWSQNGVNLMQAYDNEVGAGTQSPYTFLRANGPEPWSAAYVQRLEGQQMEDMVKILTDFFNIINFK